MDVLWARTTSSSYSKHKGTPFLKRKNDPTDLTLLSLSQLRESLERNEKLLRNAPLCENLPDKGAKLRTTNGRIKERIQVLEDTTTMTSVRVGFMGKVAIGPVVFNEGDDGDEDDEVVVVEKQVLVSKAEESAGDGPAPLNKGDGGLEEADGVEQRQTADARQTAQVRSKQDCEGVDSDGPVLADDPADGGKSESRRTAKVRSALNKLTVADTDPYAETLAGLVGAIDLSKDAAEDVRMTSPTSVTSPMKKYERKPMHGINKAPRIKVISVEEVCELDRGQREAERLAEIEATKQRLHAASDQILAATVGTSSRGALANVAGMGFDKMAYRSKRKATGPKVKVRVVVGPEDDAPPSAHYDDDEDDEDE
ncbi:hypothetical protein HK101_010537 [Irineochytrium annulatum]|nr:hypothetical protein HK101_010537 [Irineochytrium annulatum]